MRFPQNCFQFKKLVENILRMPELLTDPRFTNNRARVKNRDALIKIITDVLTRNTRDHWLTEFEGLGWGPEAMILLEIDISS